MATAKDWVTFGRIHTASLTIPGALLGVAAAGGGPWHVWLGVALWALVFHYIGFGHNNLCDLEYDRRDPAKSHMPLVAGRIREGTARSVVYAGTAAGLAFAWIIASFDLPALAAAAGATVFGVAYNAWSKRTLLAPLYISAAFAFVPLFGYYAAGGEWLWVLTPDRPIALLFWYAFALMVFQISVSGFLKEIEREDQPNLLRRTGWDVLPGQVEPGYSALFLKAGSPWPYVARLPVMVLAPVVALELGMGPIALLGGMLPLQSALFLVTLEELGEGLFGRPRRVRLMALNEILAYWLLVFAFSPLLGAVAALAFASLPLAWFVGFNFVLWRSLIGPKV